MCDAVHLVFCSLTFVWLDFSIMSNRRKYNFDVQHEICMNSRPWRTVSDSERTSDMTLRGQSVTKCSHFDVCCLWTIRVATDAFLSTSFKCLDDQPQEGSLLGTHTDTLEWRRQRSRELPCRCSIREMLFRWREVHSARTSLFVVTCCCGHASVETLASRCSSHS